MMGGLQRKLIATYMAVGLSVATLSLTAIYWVHQREEAIDRESDEAVLHAQKLATLAASVFEDGLSYVITGKDTEREACLRRLELLGPEQQHIWESSMGAAQATSLQRLDEATSRVVESTGRMFREYERGEWHSGGESFAAFDSSMDALMDETQALIVAINHQADQRTVQMRKILDWAVIGIGAVAVLLATWMGSALGRRLTRPLQRLRDAATEFGRGDLDLAKVEVREGDEIGDLARAFKEMAKDVGRLVATVADQKSHLEDIFRSMAELVIVCGADGIIASLNRSAATTLGYEPTELVGKSIDSLLDSSWLEDVVPRALHGREGAKHTSIAVTVRTKEGKQIPAMLSTTRLAVREDAQPSTGGVLCVLQDLREFQRLENQLRQAQKLEAIGRLASGIAHEINTPVQFVSHSLHFIRDASVDLISLVEKYRSLREAAPPKMLELFDEAREDEEAVGYPFIVENLPRALLRSAEGLERIATIIQSMKEFAHPGQKTALTIDLNAAVSSTLTIASSEYRYVADLETDFGELPPVMCYAGELNQAILNIVVNAAHAIGEVVEGTGQRGRITVRTRCEENTVVISIRDTGGGIPEQIRDHIFDPFFTTKDVGKGTGQGLALAWAIVVDKHGGSLTFETETGQGSTFIVRLPVHGRVEAIVAAVA